MLCNYSVYYDFDVQAHSLHKVLLIAYIYSYALNTAHFHHLALCRTLGECTPRIISVTEHATSTPVALRFLRLFFQILGWH